MNNNFYEIPENWYKQFNSTFDIPSTNQFMNKFQINNQKNLTTPKIGLDRGNLFNNLYDPYKNYRYKELNPTNKREELLFDIMKYKFAMQELTLYLDTNPQDTEAINLFNKYMHDELMACNEYEKKYGPLTLNNMQPNKNNWQWIESPWPWEGTR